MAADHLHDPAIARLREPPPAELHRRRHPEHAQLRQAVDRRSGGCRPRGRSRRRRCSTRRIAGPRPPPPRRGYVRPVEARDRGRARRRGTRPGTAPWRTRDRAGPENSSSSACWICFARSGSLKGADWGWSGAVTDMKASMTKRLGPSVPPIGRGVAEVRRDRSEFYRSLVPKENAPTSARPSPAEGWPIGGPPVRMIPRARLSRRSVESRPARRPLGRRSPRRCRSRMTGGRPERS